MLFAAKLCQHTKGALGVEEADMETFSATTRLLVDEAYSLFFALVKGCVGVFDGESNVVHATLATVLLDERGYGAFGAGRLQELYFHVADLKKAVFTFWSVTSSMA